MHGPLIPDQQVDDFIILRARALTSRTRRRLSHEVLHNEDLSILEWQLLFSIARFGSCHVGHITNETSIDPAHGSRAAATLEKKALINRVEDPHNRRRKVVSLTAQGRRVFDRIWPKARQVTADHTDRLTPAELAELKRLLDLVNGAPQTASTAQPNAPRTPMREGTTHDRECAHHPHS